MPVISLGTALFDVFTFIWWPNTCVIHLFYLPYGGTKKKKLWIFLLLKNMYVKMFMFSVYHQASPRQVLSWHVYFINILLNKIYVWIFSLNGLKTRLKWNVSLNACLINVCLFFSSSDCLLLVSIIQTIQLIIYHEKHRHGTKFQF